MKPFKTRTSETEPSYRVSTGHSELDLTLTHRFLADESAWIKSYQPTIYQESPLKRQA